MSGGFLPFDADADLICRTFNVSRESRVRLDAFAGLLLKWQSRINLIGPSTVESLWRRHIADSLQVVDFIDCDAGTIIDFGSGAGLPGLPAAVVLQARQPVTVHLIEANQKKAAFLREAIRVTDAPCIVHPQRIDALPLPGLARADVVLSRALAPLPKLLKMCHADMESGAKALFHKGQDVDTELTEATKYWNIEVVKHTSRVDPASSILEIREIRRVKGL